MTITMELITQIREDLDGINVLNYKQKTRKCIKNFLRMTRCFSPKLREGKLEALNNIIWRRWSDIGFNANIEKLDDKYYFDRYFNKIVKEMI